MRTIDKGNLPNFGRDVIDVSDNKIQYSFAIRCIKDL